MREPGQSSNGGYYKGFPDHGFLARIDRDNWFAFPNPGSQRSKSGLEAVIVHEKKVDCI